MPQPVTVRFGRVLNAADSARLDSLCASAGATCLPPVKLEAFTRTYVRLQAPAGFDGTSALAALEPQLVRNGDCAVLMLTLASSRAAGKLAVALRRSAPAGLLETAVAGDAVLVEIDDALTPLTLILELIDLELERMRETRRARAILPLTDATVARTLAHVWNVPELGAARILETYLDAV